MVENEAIDWALPHDLLLPPRTISTKRSCWGDEACRRRTTTINSTAGTPRPKMSFQYAFPSEAPMSPSVSQVPTSGVTPSTGSKCSGMPCWGLGSKATCTLPVKPERGWEVVLTRNSEEMVYLTVLSSDTEGFKFLFPLSQAQEPQDKFFSPQPFGNLLLLLWSSDTVWLLSKNLWWSNSKSVFWKKCLPVVSQRIIYREGTALWPNVHCDLCTGTQPLPEGQVHPSGRQGTGQPWFENRTSSGWNKIQGLDQNLSCSSITHAIHCGFHQTHSIFENCHGADALE